MSEQPNYEALIENERERIAYHKSHMEYHAGHLRAVLKLQEMAESRSKDSEFPEVGNYPMGYQKSATGAMEPRTVHVLHVTTGQKSESRAFWPDATPVEGWKDLPDHGAEDIRIDPPYDR